MAVSGRRLFRRASLIGVLLVFFWQVPLSVRAQLSTADHLAEPGFWPTQPGASRAEYTGAVVCASCHAAKVASQKTTPMANTTMHAADSEILHSHTAMNFAVGPYRYEINTSAKGSAYSVTNGKQTSTATLFGRLEPAKWASLTSSRKRMENFYEARVTYFDTLQNLNFTPSRALSFPQGCR